jgi:hypothetical protein
MQNNTRRRRRPLVHRALSAVLFCAIATGRDPSHQRLATESGSLFYFLAHDLTTTYYSGSRMGIILNNNDLPCLAWETLKSGGGAPPRRTDPTLRRFDHNRSRGSTSRRTSIIMYRPVNARPRHCSHPLLNHILPHTSRVILSEEGGGNELRSIDGTLCLGPFTGSGERSSLAWERKRATEELGRGYMLVAG